jgi:hypothetical protein
MGLNMYFYSASVENYLKGCVDPCGVFIPWFKPFHVQAFGGSAGHGFFNIIKHVLGAAGIYSPPTFRVADY